MKEKRELVVVTKRRIGRNGEKMDGDKGDDVEGSRG